MKKHLIIFGPVEEFHTFQKFNAFLYSIKKDYDKISAVVFEKSIGIISEADELLIISNNFLDSKNANYPTILENMVNRDISDYKESTLITIKEKYPNSEILFYNYLTIKDEHNNIYFPWYSVSNVEDSFKRDVKLVRNWLDDKNLLYPSQSSLDVFETNYKEIVNENTFIFITRNFKNKQEWSNTHLHYPQTKDFIQFLLNKGYYVLNIGYPPSNFDVDVNHETGKYQELFPDFNQDVLFSLFMKAKGVFSFTSGLFVNVCSYANILKLEIEFLPVWDTGETFIDVKKRIDDIQSIDLIEEYNKHDFKSIYEKIKDLTPPKKIKTSKSQKINYLI